MFNEKQLSGAFSGCLGEFKDKQLEAEYIQDEAVGTLKHIRPVVLVLGLLFFLFVVPDYYLTQSPQIFRMILLIRSAFFLLVLILYLVIGLRPNYYTLVNWLTAYKFLVSVFFLLIFYLYESPNFLIQSFGVVALILAFFLVTNRWLYVVIISALLGAGFIFTAFFRFETIPASELGAVTVYITLVLMMSSISSYRINYYKHMQYLYNRELRRASEIDSLTGIYNKARFNEEIEKWMDLAGRYNHALSLVLLDVDDFKKINDQYGHLAGDRVLSTLAEIVKGGIRQSDVFARWGGDEFAILLPHTGKEQAYEQAERIRGIINSHRFVPVGHINCSFGVAVYRADDNSGTFLSRADEKLYRAKKMGKNRVM